MCLHFLPIVATEYIYKLEIAVTGMFKRLRNQTSKQKSYLTDID